MTPQEIKQNTSIDKSQLTHGLIGVNYTGQIPADRKIKVFTTPPDGPEYHYNLQRQGLTWYPLQYGNRDYTVQVLYETAPGTSLYKRLIRDTVRVNMNDPTDVFLTSHVNTEWDAGMRCIQHAQKLVAGKTGDKAKLEAIRKYMAAHYSYDCALAASVKYNYIPDIEVAFARKMDICFGLTALLNGMLKCQGVKAKMMHGRPKDSGVYHAWSNVLIDGKWVTVDITHDIAYSMPVECKASDYEVTFFY